MLKWDSETETYSLVCDWKCGASLSVKKSDFTQVQWEGFEPEKNLEELALRIGWDNIWDDNSLEIAMSCPGCVCKKAVGL